MRLALATLLLLAAPLAAGDRDEQEEKLEDLDEISSLLNELASDDAVSPDQRFLHERVERLLVRAREAPAGSYLFDRLDDAMGDLLEASEELLAARRQGHEEDAEEDAQRRTARDLERSYFRVKQSDYFARQSREADAAGYVELAQRLYQHARSSYDAGRYWQARRFAEAAREVVFGLEGLAQAAVPIPDPPTL